MKKTILRSIIVAMILALGLFCTGGIAFAEGEVVQQFSSAAEITAALNSAEKGTTVKGELTGNLTAGFTVSSGKSLELDMKEFTVNGKINNYGSFTASNGTVRVSSGNAINCQAGTVNITDVIVSSGGGSSFNSDTADMITIEDCKVVSESSRAMYIDCSTLEMTGSEVTGKTKGLYANSSSVTVSDTTITAGSSYAMAIEKYCEGTITGSEIKTTGGTDSAPAFYCKGEGCKLSAENCEISIKGISGEAAAELKGQNNSLSLKKCEISSESGNGVSGMTGKLYMEDCRVKTSGEGLYCVDLYDVRADFELNTLFASEGASGIRAAKGNVVKDNSSINVDETGGNGIVVRDGSTFILNGTTIMTDSSKAALVNRNGRLTINYAEILAQNAYVFENRGEDAKATIGDGVFISDLGILNKGDIKIAGGEFSFEPEEKYLAKGSTVEKEGAFWIVSSNEVTSAPQLQEAIDNAKAGEVIYLGCDIRVDEQEENEWGGVSIDIPKEKRVTIELNGNDIIREAANDRETVNVNGDLTIRDEEKAGKVEGVNVNYGAEFTLASGTVFGSDDLTAINSMGKVEIEGGTVKSEGNWAISSAFNRKGLIITGGKFISKGKNGAAILINNGETEISNATIEAEGTGIDISGEGSTAKIDDSTVFAGANCVRTGYGASCEISEGDYTATGEKSAIFAHQENAEILINSGNFTAKKGYAVYVDDGDGNYSAEEMPKATVKGGVFTSKNGFCGEDIIKDGNLTKYEISSNCFAVSEIMYTPAKKTIKRARKMLTVYTKAKPAAYGADGFQVSYKLKGKKTWKSTYSTSSKTVIKKLKKKRYYYVKIRSFKILGGTAFYSDWTKAYKVKTK